MLPKHMPYYRGPRIHDSPIADNTHNSAVSRDGDVETGENTPQINTEANTLLSAILPSLTTGPEFFSICPLVFGDFGASSPPIDSNVRQLYSADLPVYAYNIARFRWAVYGFNSGHFISSIKKRNLPFDIILACDPFAYGRALFHKVAHCSDVFNGANALLDHIRASGQTYSIDGYLIYSHRYLASESTTIFWTLQASIIENLFNLRRLCIFVAFVHPDHDGWSVSKFIRQLHIGGWVITRTVASFPDFGDSVVGTVSVLLGIHTSTQSKVHPLLF